MSWRKSAGAARCPHCGAHAPVPDSSNAARETSGLPGELTRPSGASQTVFPFSPGAARVAIILLVLNAVLALALLLFSFPMRDLSLPAYHSNLFVPFMIALAAWTIITVIQTIVFLVWVYRFHRDLRHLHPDYPISPAQAVCRAILPVYQIWGFWTIFSQLTVRFRTEPRFRSPVLSWLIIFYICLIISYVYFVTLIWPSDTISYRGLFTAWDLLQIAFAVVSYVALIGLVRLSNIALMARIQHPQ